MNRRQALKSVAVASVAAIGIPAYSGTTHDLRIIESLDFECLRALFDGVSPRLLRSSSTGIATLAWLPSELIMSDFEHSEVFYGTVRIEAKCYSDDSKFTINDDSDIFVMPQKNSIRRVLLDCSESIALQINHSGKEIQDAQDMKIIVRKAQCDHEYSGLWQNAYSQLLKCYLLKNKFVELVKCPLWGDYLLVKEGVEIHNAMDNFEKTALIPLVSEQDAIMEKCNKIMESVTKLAEKEQENLLIRYQTRYKV